MNIGLRFGSFASHYQHKIYFQENWKGQNGYVQFKEDVGVRPNKYYRLYRINPKLGFTKENLYWRKVRA